MTGAAKLRQLLGEPGSVVAPGAHDTMTARIVELAGFQAVYTGGLTVAAGEQALPDNGLISTFELIEHAKRTLEAVDLPLIIDLDDGGGHPLLVHRYVRAAERAGIAGFHIEDVDYSHGKHFVDDDPRTFWKTDKVLPVEDAVDRVRAALEARVDPDTVIIARTDAAGLTSLDDAVDRCGRFAEAGADVILPTHVEVEDYAKFMEFGVPVMNVGTRMLGATAAERSRMEELGVKMFAYPLMSLWVSFAASWSAMRHLRDHHEAADFEVDDLVSNYQAAVRAMDWTHLARKYFADV